jgi:precorrin-2/cobalt-factor-2 C20-methyltransferase
MTTYKLTAVGLGPGDPELITMKGWRAIRAAQLIFVPRSRTGEQSLALRIAQSSLELERQHIVELLLPMTRNSAELIPAWQAAADQIAAQFARHDDDDDEEAHLTDIKGVYLLLGDPLLYGTFINIWEQLVAHHPRIEIEIVPGVTSFAASAARAQMPLSTTSDRVAILPASYETDAAQLRRLLADFDTVILMKVGRVLPQILEALAEMDLLNSTVYAERVGMPEERIAFGAELAALRNERRPYLSLLIVKR